MYLRIQVDAVTENVVIFGDHLTNAESCNG